MTTVAEIVERVQRRVVDASANVTTEIQTLVLEAHRMLQEEYNFSVMERRESRTTTAGDPSLGTIDASASATVGGSPGEYFKEYKADEPPFWTDDSGNTQRLVVSFNEYEVRQAFSQDTTTGLGPPRVLLHRHAAVGEDDPGQVTWMVYPVPDGLANTSDGEYSIQIPFYRYLAPPGSSDWFTNNATDFLLAMATSRAFELNWDEAKALYWRIQAVGPLFDQRHVIGGHLLRAINRDKRMKVSAVNTLVPYAGVNEPKLRL